MTTTGSGVGGNLGGPMIPLQEDIAKTAWTEVNKASMGIVYDSIETAFTQMNPRYTTGYMGGFGYRAASENPVLDHPLENVRASDSFEQPSDSSWEQTYNDLINMLPSDMKTLYLNEAALPLADRTAAFTATDSVMRGAAQFLTQLNTVPETFSPDSLQAARTALNQLLPFAALKGSLANTGEIMLAVQTYLIQQGSNYTNFDGYISTMRQIDASLLLLEFVNQSLSTTTNGQLSDEAIAAASRAAVLLGALSTQLSSVSLGSDLQILLTAVNTLQLVALSMALPDTNSAPLFFALSLALQGAYLSDSELGEIGPAIESLITALTSGALASDEFNTSIAGNAFLAAIIASTFVLSVSLSSIETHYGIGQTAIGGGVDSAAVRLLAFQAAMQLILSSGVATTLFTEAASLSGAAQATQAQTASVLILFTLLLCDNAAASTTNTAVANLTDWQRTAIEQGIAAALALPSNDDEVSTATRIALETASRALQDNDWSGFNDAMGNVFDAIGITGTALQSDLTTITTSADTTANALWAPNFDQTLTRMITVA